VGAFDGAASQHHMRSGPAPGVQQDQEIGGHWDDSKLQALEGSVPCFRGQAT